jgi:PAS domain S-box-containing protein
MCKVSFCSHKQSILDSDYSGGEINIFCLTFSGSRQASLPDLNLSCREDTSSASFLIIISVPGAYLLIQNNKIFKFFDFFNFAKTQPTKGHEARSRWMTADDIKNNGREILKAIIENTNDSIYVVSSRGFEFVNPAFEKLTGYSEKEILSPAFNFLQRVHPDDRYLFSSKRSFISKPSLASSSGLVEFRLITRKGELRHVEASTSSLEENGDEALIILRDITSRKKAEEQLNQTLEKLRQAMSATIQAISLTIESRDPYTAGHQKRVSDLARSIATRLLLPEDQMGEIRLAALVHDLGKISVPAEILNKTRSSRFSRIRSDQRSSQGRI